MITTFENFKMAVDKEIEARCGLVSDDLPDFDYRFGYDSGIGVIHTARAALKAAGSY